jgi:hypothetical protein
MSRSLAKFRAEPVPTDATPTGAAPMGTDAEPAAGAPRGRPPEVVPTEAEARALLSAYLATNRTDEKGSMTTAARIVAMRPGTRPELREAILRENGPERASKHQLPRTVKRAMQASPALVQFSRNPRAADVMLGHARGTLRKHWREDRRLIAGERTSSDDGSINFMVCVPWPWGGCRCSDKFGVKVGRFQLLATNDDASDFLPSWTYTIRASQAYRAEDVCGALGRLWRDVAKPDVAVLERGVWESARVTALFAAAGVNIQRSYQPRQKLIENVFNRLWTVLSAMPGQIGRYRGEMERENKLLAAAQAGTLDPRTAFVDLPVAIAAIEQAIDFHNKTPIESKHYGKWTPAVRWREDLAAHPRPRLDASLAYLWAPEVRTWTVRRACVGGMVEQPLGVSIPSHWWAPELLDAEGRKVTVHFDPWEAHAPATITLTEDWPVKGWRAGRVLAVGVPCLEDLPTISRDAANAIAVVGGEGDISGALHRAKTMRATLRSIVLREYRATAADGTRARRESEVRAPDAVTVPARGDAQPAAHTRATPPPAAVVNRSARILDAQGVRDQPIAREARLRMVVTRLRQARTALAIDEAHHMGPNCLNACKTLVNQTPGEVICDEAGARAVAASFAAVLAQGKRVRFDEAHDGDAATAWVTAFSWDPARGIIAQVEWTSLGEELVRGRVYTSFSPEFLVNKATKRVAGLHVGRPAGGLVNEPAFGAAMPALIARSAAADPTVSDQQKPTMKKETLIKILAALAVQHDANASEEQLTALVAKHVDQLPNAGPEGIALKAQLAELATLKAAEVKRREKDADDAVKAATARGAIPPKDEAVQAKWRELIIANPDHAQLLAALPDSPALSRVTTPGIVVMAKDGLLESLRGMSKVSLADSIQRAQIYAKDIAPLFAKNYEFGLELSHVLAANSLGTLSGELITQRTLSLLKLSFPWFGKITTDFSSEGAAFNQVVKSRLRTIPGLSPFVAGTGYARANAGTTDVPITINQHNGVEIAFNANETSSTNRDLFGEQVEGCHYAIGKGLVDAVLAVITVANFANETIKAVEDIDADTMDVMDAALGGRGVVGPRFGLLTSGAYRKLGKDSSIVSLAAFQLKEVITAAMLPPIKNIQPYEVFNMPAPAGENLIGFAGTADSLALATRVPNDYANALPGVTGNGTVQIVTNPDTGISVQLVRYVDHKAAESAWRLALMWGAAKGNGASGQRLISAARA